MAFRSLDSLTAADAARAGGKAWNCARLKQNGFPVPDGIVVFADADSSQIAAIDRDPWLDRFPPDARFAVRSSGLDEDSTAQSFAGIHETELNVPRPDLVRAVTACRASANSDRAKAYRRARGMPVESGPVGVLVQQMIQPTVSGVAFTIDPLTGATGELVINAAPGVGVAVVDGRIDPDEIRVAKADGRIVSSRAGGGVDSSRSLSLPESSVRELQGLLTAIERHYGSPQDVEWCYDGTRFWIVQSRPVTTERQNATDIEWTRANLAEVLPDMTSPQALAAIAEMLNVAQRRYMGGLVAPVDELGPMVKPFGGRLYFNLSQMRRVAFITRTPPGALLRSIGHHGRIGPEDEVVPRPPLLAWIARLPDFLRILGRHLRAERLLRAHEAKIAAHLEQLGPIDPSSLTDQQIWSTIDEWNRESPETIEIVLLFGGVLFHELGLQKICARVGFPFERLLFSQLAAGERSVSAQQAFDLVALVDVAWAEPRSAEWLSRPDATTADMRAALGGSRFLAAFDAFIDRYGHRGLYESDWALPRYREDPSPILEAIRMHLRDGHDEARVAGAARAAADASAIRREFEQKMTVVQRWTLVPRARRLLRTIKNFYVWREKCRSDMIRVAAALRRWHLVLADRFVERGWLDRRDDYFFLHLHEIGAVIAAAPRAASSWRPLVASRRAEADRDRRLDMPMLMRESEVAQVLRRGPIDPHTPSGRAVDAWPEGGELRGNPVSRGLVEGDVVVITDPGDFARMKRGAILVARATDPSWTPLFTLASGVIVEVGGVLSHASTIAREYGLPALANVQHATKRLKTGDRIMLNATEGWIRRIDAEAGAA